MELYEINWISKECLSAMCLTIGPAYFYALWNSCLFGVESFSFHLSCDAKLTFIETSMALQVMYTLIRATVVPANLVVRGEGVVHVFTVWQDRRICMCLYTRFVAVCVALSVENYVQFWIKNVSYIRRLSEVKSKLYTFAHSLN